MGVALINDNDKRVKRIDEAFTTNDTEKRQKYRETIRQMEQLLLAIAEIE